MRSLTKLKGKVKKLAVGVGLATCTVGVNFVFATNAIASDTLQGMNETGTNLGSALMNVAPGIGAIILILAIFTSITALVQAITRRIRI